MIKLRTDSRTPTLTPEQFASMRDALYIFLGGDALAYMGRIAVNDFLQESEIPEHDHDDRYYTQSARDQLLSNGGHLIGEGKLWFGPTAPSKWLLVNGETIGNLSSGADHAAEGYEDVFLFLWENHSDTSCPVSGSRGISAAADFAAGKTLTLPNACGRVLMGAGQGEGMTNRTLGEKVGEEAHITTLEEMPTHRHELCSTAAVPSQTGSRSLLNATYSSGNYTFYAGGGGSHNNIQPSLVINFIIYTGVSEL